VHNSSPVQKKSLRFHARSFVAFVLTPQQPLGDWLTQLDDWTRNSPGFFIGRPVVLDLNAIEIERREIAGLIAALGERGIRVFAVEAAGRDSLGADLPPVLRGTKPVAIDERDPDGAGTGEAQARPQQNSLIIESVIRSGQSIIHPDGDLIVLGSVASGSEVAAGGSVHVYGTLRGRALAGAMGNARARIFCRRNEAELLAIDGYYRTAEDMDSSWRGKPVQSFLDDENVLRVAVLD